MVMLIVCLCIFFDENYYNVVLTHIKTQLRNEALPPNALNRLKKEFAPLLVRVPLFSMFASCFGISTISHIVAKDQTYPRFDRKIIFGAFALLSTIGYISVTIVKTCFTLSDSFNVEFTMMHLGFGLINLVATTFLLHQVLLVLKIPGLSKNSENQDIETSELNSGNN